MDLCCREHLIDCILLRFLDTTASLFLTSTFIEPSLKLKTKVNLTINPKIYQAFKEATAKSLQPKSWVIERMMKRYITEMNK